MFKRIKSLFIMFGLDISKGLATLSALPSYIRDLRKFKRQHAANTNFCFGKLYPCLDDQDDDSGSANSYYFLQDLLVAQKVFQRNPRRHMDVGSRIDGFVAHIACFRTIEVFDIRKLDSTISNVKFQQMDLMDKVGDEFQQCCDSLSCLHALEHFGLGRYGDPIKYDGYLDAYHNLYSMLETGGILYLSVPIGAQRIEFNAHRVFDITYLVSLFKEKFDVANFSYVDDNATLHTDISLDDPKVTNNFGCHYGCGIFELIKQ